MRYRLAAQWCRAGDGYGVSLRPDGVLNRQILGSKFIPWDAFTPDFPVSPGSQSLAARYERPELVRTRGIGARRDTLPVAVDPAYLTQVIHEYVNHPDRRAAIGSESERHRVAAGAAS